MALTFMTLRSMMLSVILGIAFLSRSQSPTAGGQVKPEEAVPTFSISFQTEEEITGLSLSPAILFPIQCTSDGTAFLNMLRLPDFRTRLLLSVSLSRETHTFLPEQAPGLYDMRVEDSYVSEKNVIFPVEAAEQEERGKQVVLKPNGETEETLRNLKEHHKYLLRFARDGSFLWSSRIDDLQRFEVERLGLFASGTMLVYGHDSMSHEPGLALLKEDGTLLTYLEPPARALPKSAFLRESDGTESIRVAPTQLVPSGPFLLILQNSIPENTRHVSESSTTYPLLEVSESGRIRPIQPKLPEHVHVERLIASDDNIYARGTGPDRFIYEIDRQDGKVLARFQEPSSTAFVACVHDGQFVAFNHADGHSLSPLVGSGRESMR
ncbi:MAG: hypothetical protein JO356_10205 [Acidobacteria bacterium]|nr:hypothetical protein [Acidobacteriota bacterium]